MECYKIVGVLLCRYASVSVLKEVPGDDDAVEISVAEVRFLEVYLHENTLGHVMGLCDIMALCDYKEISYVHDIVQEPLSRMYFK